MDDLKRLLDAGWEVYMANSQDNIVSYVSVTKNSSDYNSATGRTPAAALAQLVGKVFRGEEQPSCG